MSISVCPTYINNALTLKVYAVTDSAGHHEGQIAVTYYHATDMREEKL